MRGLRELVVAATSTILFVAVAFGALYTPQAQAASAAAACLGRGPFLKDFDAAAGIQPISPSTPDFSDVPASSPLYPYIEAAYQDHIISGFPGGTFQPLGCLTRAAIAKVEVIALGHATDANSMQARPSAFRDDAAIPKWARGYILEAVALGLVQGYPDGTFRPDASMTATDKQAFLSQYRKVAAKLAYGAAWELEMSVAPATVAGGQTQEEVVFTVIDARGNEVADFSGTAEATLSAGAGIWVSSSSQAATVQFQNGQASDYIQFPSALPANGTATITVSDLAGPGGAPVSGVPSATFLVTYRAP